MIAGLELVGAILFLALVGVPLFVIVGFGTVLGFKLFLPGAESNITVLTGIVQDMESLTSPGKSSFIAIPFFIAAGSIMTAGGIAKRLIAVARATVGWLPGGIAIASIMACMFFAAISGSSPVTLIAVGAIMFPAMTKSGYPENFAIGLLTTAGSLGCLVPPSISLLIYSISVSGQAGSVDPETMFLAGMGPALLIAGLLIAYAIVKGMKLPKSRQPFTIRELRLALREGSWALALPVLILGGIYSGLFTPTEASAVAMAYSAFVTVFIYRELTWKQLAHTLAEATVLMGSLILIIVLAFGLNRLLALAGADAWLKKNLLEWNLSPAMFLVVVNIILIVLGALMDSISATLIFAPLLAPIAIAHGIDPIHFGIIFVVNMEIGYLAPPVATNLFVASAVFKRPFGQVTKAVFPTLGLACLGLVIVMFFPTVSKGLVNWKNGTAFFESFSWSRPDHAAAATVAGGGTPGGAGDEGGGSAAGGGSSLLSKSMATAGEDDEEDEEEDDEEADEGAVDSGVAAPDGGPSGGPPEGLKDL